MIFHNILDIILFSLPLVTGFGMSGICPMKSTSGDIVPFRPPAWVFGIAWTILYILLGFSWIIARHQHNGILADILYGLITFGLIMWIVIYSCMGDKKNAIYMFLLLFISTISALCVGNLTSKLLLIPLLVWLLFAFSLNTFEISLS